MPVHGGTGGWWSSIAGKLLAGTGLGVLSRFVTPGLIDEVLAEAGQFVSAQAAAAGRELPRRRLRAVPDRLGVVFVLGLCLFRGASYPAVVSELICGLTTALAAAGWQVPAATALTGIRRRLGGKPFELLFWRLASALSPGQERWSHVCGLLAVAWDGTTVKAPAGPENIAAFGVPRGKADGHYPQVRLVMLVACGTRALPGAAMGPLRGKGTGERALASQLAGCLRAGMLLIADRGFCSWALWNTAAGAGADLLWRVTAGMHLPVVKALPDGSWLSVIHDPAAARRRTRRNGARRRRGSKLPPDTGPVPAITVRVIEFLLTVTAEDGSTRTEPYRLITTLLDHRAYPARALAAGYAWRWAIETACREFKISLRARILRSRTPELARQELWASLIIYQAVRAVICLTAAGRGLDPGRLSFTTALAAVQATLPAARASQETALAETETRILAQPVPERDGRVCVRAIREPASRFPSRASSNTPISQHADHTLTITRPAQPARTTTSQPQQPGNPSNQPP